MKESTRCFFKFFDHMSLMTLQFRGTRGVMVIYFDLIKWDASSRWPFRPNSAYGRDDHREDAPHRIKSCQKKLIYKNPTDATFSAKRFLGPVQVNQYGFSVPVLIFEYPLSGPKFRLQTGPTFSVRSFLRVPVQS